jgi:hypothetical protein
MFSLHHNGASCLDNDSPSIPPGDYTSFQSCTRIIFDSTIVLATPISTSCYGLLALGSLHPSLRLAPGTFNGVRIETRLHELPPVTECNKYTILQASWMRIIVIRRFRK